jgi:hypothetical protein
MNIFKIPKLFWVLFVLSVMLFILFFPILQDEWLARRWENQIKKQNPEELRAWALKLFSIYATNQNDLYVVITNPPPSGMPVSKYGPRMVLSSDHTDKGAIPYVFMVWRFTRARGIYVGNTNYSRNEQNIWRPGIYFYTEP